jgi:DNA-binding winged helix-turn-helix (wHTH) protein
VRVRLVATEPRKGFIVATKVMQSAEDEAQKFIHGVEELQRKSKSRVAKRARMKARTRGGARAHAS